VEVNTEMREARAIVPDDQLSLAIGKGGQNVRLAAKLSGWKIDVRSDQERNAPKEDTTAEESEEKADSAPDKSMEEEEKPKRRKKKAKEEGEILGVE
jgi:N utilization substance protein A